MNIDPQVTITLQVLCPREDAKTLPEDRQTVRSRFFWDKLVQTRFFMLRRGNLRRSLDDLLLVTQRLLREASPVISDVPSVDQIFMHSALHLQNVLRSEQYSHLQNMPVEMASGIIMWRRDRLESLAEVVIQESMEDPGNSRAVSASQEAVDALEKINPNNGSQEDGSARDPCVICLEDMNLAEVETACVQCKHKFHYDCLVRWLKMSNLCPLCRFAYPPAGLANCF